MVNALNIGAKEEMQERQDENDEDEVDEEEETEWCHKIHTLVKNWRGWIQEKRGQEERKFIV